MVRQETVQTDASGDAPMSTSSGHDPAGFMFAIGFTSITAQVLLIREIFTALYGSDVAMAFALAAWTLFGGMGAFLAAPLSDRLRRFRTEWGLLLFTVAILGVFLWVRAWGAKDVLDFHDYPRVLLFLIVPCILGGALFSWRLARCTERTEQETARAYAFETLGGLWAGLCMAGYVYAGGPSLPILVLLPFLASGTRWIAGTGPRGWQRMAAAGLAVSLVAGVGPWEGLVRRSLGLRFPGYRILAHINTPSSAMTAAERNGIVAVFENGLPAPENRPTRSKTALLTFLAQFPGQWRHVFLLRPVSSGFAGVAECFRAARVDLWETDRAKVRFFCHRQGIDVPAGLHVSASPWNAPGLERSDLVAVFGTEPASLLANRCLTREFLASASHHLTDKGTLAVILPAAPGYLHPRQVQYLRTVQAALKQCLPYVAEYRTDLGYIVYMGGRAPLPTQFRPERVRARMTQAVDAGAEAQAAAVFFDAAMLRSLKTPATVEMPEPVNSVVFPAAYYAYLLFRGAMIETSGSFWDRLFRPMPTTAVLAIILLLALTALGERGMRGTAALFWGSWVTTMSLVFSLYLSQSLVGQAYWLFALLTASGMAGIFLGARWTHPWLEAPWAGTVCLVLPGLFLGLPLFEHLPAAVLFPMLSAANGLLGARIGGLFRRTVRWGGGQSVTPAIVFGVDLLGAAGGLCIGGVLLPWWTGFRTAGLLCAAASLVAEALAFARRR